LPNAEASRVAGWPGIGYPCRMLLPVELTESQIESLRQRAKTLGISAEQLAAAAVVDLVSQPAEDFGKAASRVLSKNGELYRRLA
jgi:hypothetical protein